MRRWAGAAAAAGGVDAVGAGSGRLATTAGGGAAGAGAGAVEAGAALTTGCGRDGRGAGGRRDGDRGGRHRARRCGGGERRRFDGAGLAAGRREIRRPLDGAGARLHGPDRRRVAAQQGRVAAIGVDLVGRRAEVAEALRGDVAVGRTREAAPPIGDVGGRHEAAVVVAAGREAPLGVTAAPRRSAPVVDEETLQDLGVGRRHDEALALPAPVHDVGDEDAAVAPQRGHDAEAVLRDGPANLLGREAIPGAALVPAAPSAEELRPRGAGKDGGGQAERQDGGGAKRAPGATIDHGFDSLRRPDHGIGAWPRNAASLRHRLR